MHPLVLALDGLGGPPARAGVVHIVGGGPGDPGLLTARACVVLATCDVVLHDRLSPPEALALVPDHAEVIQVGRRKGEPGMTRGEVDALMATRAADGKAVVRLKGGDPFVFGRGAEEATALALAGIPFEVVSGVTSAVAAPAAAGIPVTHRGLAAGFAVVTGHEDPAKGGGHVDFATLAQFPGTILFLMGVGHVADIAKHLVEHGRDAAEPVAMVRWGTTARQRVLRATLGTVADEVARSGFGSPAVTIVGPVAGMADDLAWREHLPLFGRSVLVPRSRHQASMLSMHVRALGGEPIEAPTIDIQPPEDLGPMDDAVRRLAAREFAGLALTSPNGVDALADAIDRVGVDARALATVDTVACVGPGTAARLHERLRVHPDLVPDTSTTAALGAAWPEPDPAGGGAGDGRTGVLLPRADLATDELVELLTGKGWEPVRVDAYRTLRPEAFAPEVADRLADGTIDLIAFASSSTARNFAGMVGSAPWAGRVVSIGPVTSATCTELRIDVHTEANPHDLDGLVEALVRAAADLGPLR